MEIGNLRGADDILPALLPRNTTAAGGAQRSAAVPIEPHDVFSQSDESRSIAAFVAQAQAQDGDREGVIARAEARLRNGELDGSQVYRTTAEKILQSIRDKTLEA